MLDYIGWVGVCVGIFINVPQLVGILKTKKTANVSIGTYALLVLAVTCYLIHAVDIMDAVFITTNSVALVVCSWILILLIRNRR